MVVFSTRPIIIRTNFFDGTGHADLLARRNQTNR